MTTSVVEWDRHDAAFVVTMQRPPANALGLPLLEGLHAALEVYESTNCRVLILRSALPGFFAAGADIKLMGELTPAGFANYGSTLRHAVERIAQLDRPSVAVVSGRALGGGLELALACSIRVAARSAGFGLPEPRLGLIAGAGGTQRLTRLIGRGRALDLMLTAREIGADEAFNIGLVERLASGDDADAIALELAADMTRSSRAALTAVLRCVDDAEELGLADGLAAEATRENHLFDRGEGREGIAAFLERRPARFA